MKQQKLNFKYEIQLVKNVFVHYLKCILKMLQDAQQFAILNNNQHLKMLYDGKNVLKNITEILFQ